MPGRKSGAKGRRRGQLRRKEGIVAMIDRLLMKPVNISLSGRSTQVATIEAIMLQLLEKGRDGNNRAWQVLLRLQQFARQRSKKGFEVRFADNDYTRAFSNSGPGGDHG